MNPNPHREEPEFTPIERQLIDALARLPQPDIAPGADEVILRAAAAKLQQRRQRHWIRTSIATAAVATVACVATLHFVNVPETNHAIVHTSVVAGMAQPLETFAATDVKTAMTAKQAAVIDRYEFDSEDTISTTIARAITSAYSVPAPAPSYSYDDLLDRVIAPEAELIGYTDLTADPLSVFVADIAGT